MLRHARGVRRGHVESCLRDPSGRHAVRYHGLAVHLLAQSGPPSDPGGALLLGYRPPTETDLTVDFAYRVPAAVATRAGSSAVPLALLREFAQEFGLPLQVGGGDPVRFLHSACVPLDRRGKPLLEVDFRQRRFISAVYMERDPGPPPVMRCALAFALDVDRYLLSLGPRR